MKAGDLVKTSWGTLAQIISIEPRPYPAFPAHLLRAVIDVGGVEHRVMLEALTLWPE